MLTCIACSKQPGGGGGEPLHEPPEDEDAVDGGGGGGGATPSTRLAIKALTAQVGFSVLHSRESRLSLCVLEALLFLSC
ncbi:Os09g0444500 [Oryza sativa Japonica Group]|uniref:Os09g0444500 protein n=2 Tax=Oryza sativa subsp. japonica TaxID=39947 RepID=C7J711_ORYSJ|nr:hypothetical protein EE612_048155 [Oryza sativa]BAD38097.1 unknown protein [Oryza sativa Japonica Group]BAD38313.1 unknown protein [Oryza sativa Japonica Group]BAH94589.1 Os09g0444500 [Oryza sativa Japonica Group]BAT08328.1 Os09g0444500 [Oryza sativa Japonica Group]|eukprot:NP_001175861.1 Os09g0444500 [Oryza sativa Japonica Group]